MLKWYLQVWKKYGDFSGRARRREYWIFSLVHSGFLALLSVIAGYNNTNNDLVFACILLGGIYFLASFLPGLAVTARRLHDTGHGDWFLLLYFIPLGSLLIFGFLLQDSDSGANEYGDSPKTNHDSRR
jgi:uncharacterized membrane protein YhaH (DUF805 family)